MFAWHYYKKHHKIERKTATSPNTHKYAHGYIRKCLCISKLILDEIMQQSSHFSFYCKCTWKENLFLCRILNLVSLLKYITRISDKSQNTHTHTSYLQPKVHITRYRYAKESIVKWLVLVERKWSLVKKKNAPTHQKERTSSRKKFQVTTRKLTWKQF